MYSRSAGISARVDLSYTKEEWRCGCLAYCARPKARLGKGMFLDWEECMQTCRDGASCQQANRLDMFDGLDAEEEDWKWKADHSPFNCESGCPVTKFTLVSTQSIASSYW